MNPVWIAEGVFLTARILHCLFDELTDREREEEAKNRSTVEAYNRKIAARRKEAQQLEEEAPQELVQEKNRYLLEQAGERQKEEQSLHEEIRDSIRIIKKALGSMGETTTALRRSGLERLLNQLYEAKERCYGYQKYLEDYILFVGSALEREDVEPFSMRIPPEYPYIGKICLFSVDQLVKADIYSDDSLPGILISYYLDPDEGLDDYGDGCTLPFMVERYDRRRRAYVLSLVKGIFYTEALQNTRIGVRAVVREIRPKGIILTYQNSLRLFLRRENLMKPYRTPPVRSEMMVYPMRWTYGLMECFDDNFSVRVSEKPEDAMAGFRFQLFPVVFTGELWAELNRYMTENHITYRDEWKIGPLESTELCLKDGLVLKLQFGDALILQASLFALEGVENETQSAQQYILRFQKILPTDARFLADDIFVDIDVDLTPVLTDNLAAVGKVIDLQEAQLFLLDVFSEFQTQKQIKESMAGSRYFQQWSVIGQKLIDYLKKGQEFMAQVANVEADRNNLRLDISNYEQIRRQAEGYAREQDLRRNGNPGRINFFIEDTNGMPCGVLISPDFQTVTVYNCTQNSLFLQEGDYLCIYAETVPYPEIQQNIALSQLRTGRLVNSVLQTAMMAGENVSSEVEDIGEFVLKNAAIAQNDAQYQALLRALSEKNIFFIQGPPGTGKTTIIRELVEQQLVRNPQSRILIVSQANVAVDNALSGIVRNHRDVTVRCGNASKISSSLQEVTLDRQYERYIEKVKLLHGKADEEIYTKWIEFVAPEKGINPNIGELIIKSCKIVGATCIGLAKKRIGLERIDFDLVIADEAGKALPGEILIPVLRAGKLVMIGDHQQLPPVIHPALYDPEKIELEDRDVVENSLFSVSLFERLFETMPESNKTMLRTQYRMPAVIGTMVSKLFYNNCLENGVGTEQKMPLFSNHNLTFYDFTEDALYREKKQVEFGIINTREADFIAYLLLKITKKAPGHSIAVITPYRGQMRYIQNTILQVDSMLRSENIRINTIDAFQGDEAEIVIYCTTRGDKRTRFFSDDRRINVALSRAKNELIILGRLQYFDSYRQDSSPLPAIADYIRANGEIIRMTGEWSIHKKKEISERIVSKSKVFCYHALEDVCTSVVDNAVQYYYQHGQMERPLLVHLEGDRYIVDDNFDIFLALQELELRECWVKIFSDNHISDVIKVRKHQNCHSDD